MAISRCDLRKIQKFRATLGERTYSVPPVTLPAAGLSGCVAANGPAGQTPLLPSIGARRPLLEAHKRMASDGRIQDLFEVNGAG